MTSLTLSLSGDSSELSANYFPHIELDQNGEYVCGLTDFQTFNSIPNINSSNNRLYFWSNDNLTLKSGLYRIGAINSLIAEKCNPDFSLGLNIDQLIVIKYENVLLKPKKGKFYIKNPIYLEALSFREPGEIIPGATYYLVEKDAAVHYQYLSYVELPTGSYELEDIMRTLDELLSTIKNRSSISLNIHVNKNTLTTEITPNACIDFTPKGSIGTVFGFKNNRILDADVTHKSDGVIKINPVNALRIECNITAGAYSNNSIVHTIHEFYPSVPAGYKIVEVPRNVIYLPVIEKNIHNLTVRVVDQDNKLVSFQGETISLRLHIKRL